MSEFFWPLDRALSNCTTVRQVAMPGVWVLHCRLRKKKMSWKEHLEGCSPNSCSKQGKLQNQIRLLKVLSSFQNHRGWRLNSPFKPLLQRCTRSAAMIFFFRISKQHFPRCSLWLLPPVLLQCVSEKSPALSSPWDHGSGRLMTYPAGLFFSRLTKPRGPASPHTPGAPVPYLPSLGSFQPVSSSVSAGPELQLGSLTAWGALDFACAIVDSHGSI